jgi:hypothetical protein
MTVLEDDIKPIVIDSHEGKIDYSENPMPFLLEKEYLMRTGPGLFVFKGPLVKILDVINSEVLKITDSLNAERCEVPTLISWPNAERSEYLKSFSNLALMMKTHEDQHGCFKGIACPSICYHYFSAMHKRTVESNFCVTVKGCVTRNEKDEKDDLSRLTNFTVRDIVFYGTKDYCDESLTIVREKATQLLIEKFGLSFSVVTANDPFFGENQQEKADAQLFLQSKYEFQAELPFKGTTISIGSINNHGQIFYDRFEIKSGKPDLRFSGCVGWGYERILFAILSQKGVDFSTPYYEELFAEHMVGNEVNGTTNFDHVFADRSSDAVCSRCLKTVYEDSQLNGPGLVKTVTNLGQEEYICHVCFKGF